MLNRIHVIIVIGQPYQKHWLEEDELLSTSGALVYLLEMAEGYLHSFAQYHMLSCVYSSFRAKCAAIVVEWSKRRKSPWKQHQAIWRPFYESTDHTYVCVGGVLVV